MLPLFLPLLGALLTGPGPGALRAPATPVPLAAASGHRAAGAPADAQEDRRLADFRAWLGRLETGRERLEEQDPGAVQRRIGDVAVWAARDGDRAPEAELALLDLLGLCLAGNDPPARRPSPNAPGSGTDARAAVQTAVARTLAAGLDAQCARRIARDVLMIERSHPSARRLAAAWLLARERHPEGMMALVVLASGDDAALAELALEGLAGWDDATVHAAFVAAWERPPAACRAAALAAVERHFRSVRLPCRSALETRLGELVKLRLAAFVWQDASRAIAVSHALADDYAVPLLIEALSLWIARGESGRQSLRLQSEIAGALEARSGRSMGTRLESWRTWWRARQEDRASAADAVPEDQRTQAEFFGLRPMSDRIAFLIDRSQSMSAPFGQATRTAAGGAAWTRHDEAVDQVMGFLQTLGPACRFRLVAFDTDAETWHSDLNPATAANLRSARTWLKGRRPDGSTNLKAGVERCLAVRNGALDLEELDVDTIVVLCDGATDQGGPGWVLEFLELYNADARIVFHCVQIGASGDGTLEELAESTGGDFIQVDV